MPYADALIKMVPYFTTIHHTPGRLRVKIDAGIRAENPGISFDAVAGLQGRLEGLEQIRLNKVMATVTILYDPKRLPPEAWDALLAGELRGPFAELADHLIAKENP